MPPDTASTRISREEYLQGELSSEIRHEYVAGNVYAMSGGTLNHQRIAGNFLRMAGNQLAGKTCFPTPAAFSNFKCPSAAARRLSTIPTA
jgi:Uma2 family endonuclease